MLYPVLHRLEDNDFIESYWGKSETGRRRKLIYMIIFFYKQSHPGT